MEPGQPQSQRSLIPSVEEEALIQDIIDPPAEPVPYEGEQPYEYTSADVMPGYASPPPRPLPEEGVGIDIPYEYREGQNEASLTTPDTRFEQQLQQKGWGGRSETQEQGLYLPQLDEPAEQRARMRQGVTPPNQYPLAQLKAMLKDYA